MEYIIIVIKLIVGLSILNVWLLRNGKSSQWRGGGASSLEEEFSRYGLSKTTMILVGIVKCTLAIGLLLSIFYPELEFYSALGIVLMMAVAIAMHVKISDPIKKSFPALLFLILSAVIVLI
ncbi:DoxX family protein [Dokdonia sp. Hel_I_53]|uniref:DoxX family protein n=1 Tax=Dokdonia sp. Hel_I_53 TaxID=1566287 RepID=UPI00119C2A85|nr:DoxX family protein [Dokdonia sp. Hel_I_53]TVZ51439.1 DoxX-like protein [Dokdonia sp. Hel_I_53]